MTRSQPPREAFQTVGQVQRLWGGMTLVGLWFFFFVTLVVLKVRQEAREHRGKGVSVVGSHRQFWILGGTLGGALGLLSREGCDLTRFQGSSIHCEGSGDEEATVVVQAGGDGGWSGRGQGKWSEGSRTLEQS